METDAGMVVTRGFGVGGGGERLVRGYGLPVGERVLQISGTANSVGSELSNAVLIPASG